MSTHWLVVAAPDHAKIYATDSNWSSLVPVDELVHPESRIKAAELLTHPHGHGPHALAPHAAPPPIPGADPLEHAQREFAASVAARLHEGRSQGQFARYVLVAPASFLAQVEGHLTPDTAERRHIVLARQWTHLAPDQLEAELADALASH